MTTKEEVEELIPPKDDKDFILQDDHKQKSKEKVNSVLGGYKSDDNALNFSFDEKAC
jgi:phage shock protein A